MPGLYANLNFSFLESLLTNEVFLFIFNQVIWLNIII